MLVIVLAATIIISIGLFMFFPGECTITPYEKYVKKMTSKYPPGYEFPCFTKEFKKSNLETIPSIENISNIKINAEQDNFKFKFNCDSMTTCENVYISVRCDKEMDLIYPDQKSNIPSNSEVGYIIESKENEIGQYNCTITLDDKINPGQPWAKSKNITIKVE